MIDMTDTYKFPPTAAGYVVGTIETVTRLFDAPEIQSAALRHVAEQLLLEGRDDVAEPIARAAFEAHVDAETARLGRVEEHLEDEHEDDEPHEDEQGGG